MPHRALKLLPDQAPAATIAILRSNSLPTLVQKEIERMILAGELSVGAKLNEVAVAAFVL